MYSEGGREETEVGGGKEDKLKDLHVYTILTSQTATSQRAPHLPEEKEREGGREGGGREGGRGGREGGREGKAAMTFSKR